jgi:hypothetical protein
MLTVCSPLLRELSIHSSQIMSNCVFEVDWPYGKLFFHELQNIRESDRINLFPNTKKILSASESASDSASEFNSHIYFLVQNYSFSTNLFHKSREDDASNVNIALTIRSNTHSIHNNTHFIHSNTHFSSTTHSDTTDGRSSTGLRGSSMIVALGATEVRHMHVCMISLLFVGIRCANTGAPPLPYLCISDRVCMKLLISFTVGLSPVHPKCSLVTIVIIFDHSS